MCLDKFNPTILCGNIPNLLFILGLELPGYFLCSPIMYMSSYAIQKLLDAETRFYLYVLINETVMSEVK